MKKNVVLGVTGSIAAYKACDIVSALRKKNINVDVILSKAGSAFVTPLALEALSQNPVTVDMFDRETPWEVGHIALAKKADVFLIAPATANFLGKAAYGVADDMLTTTILAAKAPVLVAPAMNTNMYKSAAVQENIKKLEERGYSFLTPGSGRLACGDEGIGKLAPVEDIVAAVLEKLQLRQDFAGIRLLVSAGPTQEKIDPVRYITNHSSGKMGYAIAQAAQERGAEVTLISGPVSLPTPDGVRRIDVISSLEMQQAVSAHFAHCDGLIMAAAPADFTPEECADQKIKKDRKETLQLSLRATEDILKSVGDKKGSRVVMGFAAETENLAQNAKDKLINKNLDFIAANDVGRKDAGFEVNTNCVTLYVKDGTSEHSGDMTKLELAHWLLDRLKTKLR